jgi:hypothetical protein
MEGGEVEFFAHKVSWVDLKWRLGKQIGSGFAKAGGDRDELLLAGAAHVTSGETALVFVGRVARGGAEEGAEVGGHGLKQGGYKTILADGREKSGLRNPTKGVAPLRQPWWIAPLSKRNRHWSARVNFARLC